MAGQSTGIVNGAAVYQDAFHSKGAVGAAACTDQLVIKYLNISLTLPKVLEVSESIAAESDVVSEK